MLLNPNRHIDDERMEQYLIGSLSEPQCVNLEEHVLVCQSCQDKLAETDVYIGAMCTATSHVSQRQSAFGSNTARHIVSELLSARKPLWVIGFAAAALLIVGEVGWQSPHKQDANAIEVFLEATRGAASENRAPCRRRLVFNLNVADASTADSYTLQIVNSRGTEMWASPARSRNGTLSLPMNRKLGGGEYYVRLYGGPGELLREFSLHLE